MLKRDPNYRKLKLGGRSWLNNSTYWIGPNHLLVVEISNYTERYRRFYFKDVQAILVQSTPTRLIWNLIHGALAFCALAVLLFVVVQSAPGGFQNGDYMVMGAWLALLLFFGTFILVNTLRGPTCLVQVKTAVQNQRLSGVKRWRNADALLAVLTPLVNAAQKSTVTESPVPVTPSTTPSTTPPTEPAGPNAPQMTS